VSSSRSASIHFRVSIRPENVQNKSCRPNPTALECRRIDLRRERGRSSESVLSRSDLVHFAALTTCAVSIVFAEVDPFSEEDPFAQTTQEPPRPERKISSLPKSLTYESEDGRHIYTVSGIYDTSAVDGIDDVGQLCEVYIPDCLTCVFDFEEKTCQIVTSRKLGFSELAYAVDDIAALCGDLPYWAELEARDIEEAAEGDQIDFDVQMIKQTHPKGLGWFSIPKDRKFEMPFDGAERNMKLLVVPTTAYCMCHSRFCIRILNKAGKVVWEDEEIANGSISIAVSDQNRDYVHELLLRKNDHGKESRYRIMLKRSEQFVPPKYDRAGG